MTWERQPRRTVEPPSPKFLGRKLGCSYRPQQETPSFLIGLLRGFHVYPGGAVVYFPIAFYFQPVMRSEEAGGREEDLSWFPSGTRMKTLVQLLPRPASGFGGPLVCSSLGTSYLSLCGQVKILDRIINYFFRV